MFCSFINAVEKASSTAFKLLVALVKLFAMEETAVERAGISSTSVLDMLSRLTMPLPVSMMLLFLSSSAAISPIVSNTLGALSTKLLMASLIALLLSLISAFNAAVKEASARVKEVSMRTKLDATVDTARDRAGISLEIALESDVSTFVKEVLMLAKSDATDGKLELFLLKPFSLFGIPKMIFQFFTGRSDQSSYAEVISFKKAKISLPNGVAHHDGEPVQVTRELNVQVVPHSLHIIVGQK